MMKNGAYQAVRHFIETGRRRIGLINLPGSLTTGQNAFARIPAGVG